MLKIRETIEQDAPVLSEIQKQAFLPLYEKYHDKGNPCLRGVEDVSLRLNHPSFRYFTILEDEEIVGGILYKCKGKGMFFDSLGKGEYYLQRVYIKPEKQCKRIAQRAILLCEEALGDTVYVMVDFPEDLEKNRRCYEKSGFCDTGKRMEVEPGLILACFEKRNITEKMLHEVMEIYGFSDIKILERFHKNSSRLIYKVHADENLLLLKGLPETISEDVIKGNISAHEYLGNRMNLVPRIIYAPDGTNYVKVQRYWIYIMEYIEGKNLEENEPDEYELGKVLRSLHNCTDYKYNSALSEDKTEFYNWFYDKDFKTEFDRILDQIPDFKKYDRCFIHSDIGPHNSMRSRTGKVLLIDLDDAGIGSRYLDLGWPLVMQFVDYNYATGKMQYRFNLAEAFLSGYYDGELISRNEYDLLWQGAVFMHISYMQDYGPEAVDSLWDILRFGIEQKDKLWNMITHE